MPETPQEKEKTTLSDPIDFKEIQKQISTLYRKYVILNIQGKPNFEEESYLKLTNEEYDLNKQYSIDEKLYNLYAKNILNKLLPLFSTCNDSEETLLNAFDGFLKQNEQDIINSSLFYTANSDSEITLVLCNIAKKIEQSSIANGRAAYQILMPSIKNREFNTPDFFGLTEHEYDDPEKDILRLIQTHILILRDGEYYLEPVWSPFISDINTKEKHLVNFHGDASKKVTSNDEITRILTHSDSMESFKRTQDDLLRYFSNENNLLGQLNLLLQHLRFNSKDGIGDEYSAGNYAEGPIKNFALYLKKVQDQINKITNEDLQNELTQAHIPFSKDVDLKKQLDFEFSQLRHLAKVVYDGEEYSINPRNAFHLCLQEHSKTVADLIKLYATIFAKISSDSQEEESQLADLKETIKKQKNTVLTDISEGSYIGRDRLPISFELLKRYEVQLSPPQDLNDSIQLINSLSYDGLKKLIDTDKCSLSNILHPVKDINDAVTLINKISFEKLELIFPHLIKKLDPPQNLSMQKILMLVFDADKIQLIFNYFLEINENNLTAGFVANFCQLLNDQQQSVIKHSFKAQLSLLFSSSLEDVIDQPDKIKTYLEYIDNPLDYILKNRILFLAAGKSPRSLLYLFRAMPVESIFPELTNFEESPCLLYKILSSKQNIPILLETLESIPNDHLVRFILFSLAQEVSFTKLDKRYSTHLIHLFGEQFPSILNFLFSVKDDQGDSLLLSNNMTDTLYSLLFTHIDDSTNKLEVVFNHLGEEKFLELLIKNKGSYQDTPLHHAAKNHQVNNIKFILEKYPNNEQIKNIFYPTESKESILYDLVVHKYDDKKETLIQCFELLLNYFPTTEERVDFLSRITLFKSDQNSWSLLDSIKISNNLIAQIIYSRNDQNGCNLLNSMKKSIGFDQLLSFFHKLDDQKSIFTLFCRYPDNFMDFFKTLSDDERSKLLNQITCSDSNTFFFHIVAKNTKLAEDIIDLLDREQLIALLSKTNSAGKNNLQLIEDLPFTDEIKLYSHILALLSRFARDSSKDDIHLLNPYAYDIHLLTIHAIDLDIFRLVLTTYTKENIIAEQVLNSDTLIIQFSRYEDKLFQEQLNLLLDKLIEDNLSSDEWVMLLNSSVEHNSSYTFFQYLCIYSNDKKLSPVLNMFDRTNTPEHKIFYLLSAVCQNGNTLMSNMLGNPNSLVCRSNFIALIEFILSIDLEIEDIISLLDKSVLDNLGNHPKIMSDILTLFQNKLSSSDFLKILLLRDNNHNHFFHLAFKHCEPEKLLELIRHLEPQILINLLEQKNQSNTALHLYYSNFSYKHAKHDAVILEAIYDKVKDDSHLLSKFKEILSQKNANAVSIIDMATSNQGIRALISEIEKHSNIDHTLEFPKPKLSIINSSKTLIFHNYNGEQEHLAEKQLPLSMADM